MPMSYPLSFPSTGVAMVTLTRPKPSTVLLHMHSLPDNRFSRAFCTAVLAALDHVHAVHAAAQASGESIALVSTGEGKFYSNGLDFAVFDAKISDFMREFYHPVLVRLLTAPFVTIAAVNGHAFAGGLMFALAHDYRVMRADKGFLCMNEVDIPGPLTPGMAALLRAKFPSPHVLRDSLLQARRYPGPEALSLGLVDALCPSAGDVIAQAAEMAEKWQGKGGVVYGWLKVEMWRDTVSKLSQRDVGFVDDVARRASGSSKL